MKHLDDFPSPAPDGEQAENADCPFTLGKLHAGPPCCKPVPIIELEDVSISYYGRPALQNIHLTINSGCVTALIGPSGCGKTSFLSALNRLTDLVPGCAVHGRIVIAGSNILARDLDVRALRTKVGMIFQKPNPFPLSVRRNIELPLREHGTAERRQTDARIEQVLQEVGLWDEVKDRLDSPAEALSGGQQQRLCIARALALGPQVLLLDEPCSSLDPLSTGVIEELIRRLSGRFTVVMVTHNLGQAQRLADYTAFFWMKQGAGRLVEHGPTAELFERPQDSLTAAYIHGRAG